MAHSSCTSRNWLTVAVVCLGSGTGLPALLAQIGPEADATIERCLMSGKVKGKSQELDGVTRPVKLKLECDGETRNAVFKTWDSFHLGLTRLQDGSWEMNFADSYRFERAAYLVDRELGLNMVPVAVIRGVRRNQGALIDWVSEASHENDPERTLTSSCVAALAPQKAAMHLFDALIYNIDRNVGNWLVDSTNQRLFLIDHSRSFRPWAQVPESFLAKRVWLTRELHSHLAALTRERLTELLSDLIGPAQIDALISRRDQLLELIEKARNERGESVVFRD